MNSQTAHLRVVRLPADVRPLSYAEFAIWRRIRQQPTDAVTGLCDTPGCACTWWGALDFMGRRRCPDCMAGNQGLAGGWPAAPVLPPLPAGTYLHPYPLAAAAA